MDKLIKLAKFYNVSLDYLVGRSPSEWDNYITYQQIELVNNIITCGMDPEDIQKLFSVLKDSITKIKSY